MEKLFDPISTAYDPKAKPVHLCKSANGFYVYKPSSGFKSKSFAKEDDPDLVAIYERQRHDAQTFASYLPGEAEEPKVKPRVAPVKKTPVKKTPVEKTPVKKTPVEKTPVKKTPVEKTPVAPVVETPVAPVVETPVAPVVETPVAPVVETSVAPVVETPE